MRWPLLLIALLGASGSQTMTACAETGVTDAPRHPAEPSAIAEDPDTMPLPRERRARMYDPRSAFPRDAAPVPTLDRDD